VAIGAVATSHEVDGETPRAVVFFLCSVRAPDTVEAARNAIGQK
jgi:hypothetical protein